ARPAALPAAAAARRGEAQARARGARRGDEGAGAVDEPPRPGDRHVGDRPGELLPPRPPPRAGRGLDRRLPGRPRPRPGRASAVGLLRVRPAGRVRAVGRRLAMSGQPSNKPITQRIKLAEDWVTGAQRTPLLSALLHFPLKKLGIWAGFGLLLFILRDF